MLFCERVFRYLHTVLTEVVNVCAVYLPVRTVRICWGRKGSGGEGDEFINLNSAVREKRRRRRCFHRNQGCNFCLQRGGGERRKTVSTTFSVFLKQLFLSLRFFPKICDFFLWASIAAISSSFFPFSFHFLAADCLLLSSKSICKYKFPFPRTFQTSHFREKHVCAYFRFPIYFARKCWQRPYDMTEKAKKLLLAGPTMSSRYKYNLHRKTVPWSKVFFGGDGTNTNSPEKRISGLEGGTKQIARIVARGRDT